MGGRRAFTCLIGMSPCMQCCARVGVCMRRRVVVVVHVRHMRRVMVVITVVAVVVVRKGHMGG